MTSLFGFPLLALWIMGVPLIGALISLAMPAPRLNTMPCLRHRDEHIGAAAGHSAAVVPAAAHPATPAIPAITTATVPHPHN